jgi:hypothetical protein
MNTVTLLSDLKQGQISTQDSVAKAPKCMQSKSIFSILQECVLSCCKRTVKFSKHKRCACHIMKPHGPLVW